MNVVDKAKQNQLQNIQTRTGKTLDELFATIRESGLTKHGQILQMLKSDLGMGHGDANALAGAYLKAGEQGGGLAGEQTGGPAGEASPADAWTPSTPVPRPPCGRSTTSSWRPSPHSAPSTSPPRRATSVCAARSSSRRWAGDQVQVDVGLNIKDVPATHRLTDSPPGGMCQYRVSLAGTGRSTRSSWRGSL